ncbi:MAG: histidinol-phosphatase [Chloroflexi bacterium]|nr:histidinol-phosphatase [Chloroflexota bacterium]
MLVEFHSHTIASMDSLVRPASLLAACRRKGIDRIVVTDHNTTGGAQAAFELDPQRVIIGEEIMTTRGEILAAFVVEEIPPGLTPAETIRRLRGQGAFISVSHPFDRLRSGSWAPADLLEIAPLVDAIEVFNSRSMLPSANRRAQAFANQHGLPGTAGSDAHSTWELGRSLLSLPPFEGADGLRAAIREAEMQSRMSPPWVHLLSRYAVFKKSRPH